MKPAEPVTEAGKALLNDTPDRDRHPDRTRGWYDTPALMNAKIRRIEAQAQDLILSDVEGLARALWQARHVPDVPMQQAEAILAAWRQERQR